MFCLGLDSFLGARAEVPLETPGELSRPGLHRHGQCLFTDGWTALQASRLPNLVGLPSPERRQKSVFMKPTFNNVHCNALRPRGRTRLSANGRGDPGGVGTGFKTCVWHGPGLGEAFARDGDFAPRDPQARHSRKRFRTNAPVATREGIRLANKLVRSMGPEVGKPVQADSVSSRAMHGRGTPANEIRPGNFKVLAPTRDHFTRAAKVVCSMGQAVGEF